MKAMNWNLEQDYEDVAKARFITWDLLKGKTIFITGATGLIGTSIINTLLYANEKKNLQIRILALVRDLEKALQKFEKRSQDASLRFIVGSVEELPEIDDSIDYIIHGASQTASNEFINHAVETIRTSILGTINTLELAKEKNVKSYIYLSSMEMYGYPIRGHNVVETEAGSFSPLDCRNSYPIGKVMSESLCSAYCKEYNLNIKIIRLTQTFGPGVSFYDSRVFAYFGRCVIKKENIVLKTKGETERSYLYISDAVTAIITVLLHGKKGEAYNAANKNTYCSIAKMANIVSNEVANGKIGVKYEIDSNIKDTGYANTLYMNLDTSKLEDLGWHPINGGYSIGNMFQKMCQYMDESICVKSAYCM